MDVKLGERSIVQHGSNVYYKEFTVRTGNGAKQYRLGRFYFVQKSTNYPVTIAEFQLIWQNVLTKRKFASVKLYFNPDIEYDEDNDEEEEYGKDEVVEATKQVVIECSKFPKWQCSHKNWDSSIGALAYHGIGINKIQKMLEKAAKSDENFDVKILSYPQYCRYRTCLKLLDAGMLSTYPQLLACGGLNVKNLNTVVLFSRKQFDYEDIEDLSLTENIKVPVFKGRPRKRKKNLQSTGNNKRIKLPSSSSSSFPSDMPHTQKDSVKVKTDNAKIKTNEKLAILVTKNKTPQKLILNSKPKRQMRGRDTVAKIRIYTEEKEKLEEFSMELHKFMEDQGMPIIKIPSIGCAPIEPLILYNAVKKHGGYGQVTLHRLWRNVYDCLGHSTMITNAATGTRKIYEKLLLPYEKYHRAKSKEKDTSSESTSNKKDTGTVGKPEEKPPQLSTKKKQSEKIETSTDSCIMTLKQRGRSSTKFNNQIEKLRNKQTRKLEEARLSNKTSRILGKKPPWVNDLNVDIVNSRRKSDVVSVVPNLTTKRPEKISVDDDIIAPRRYEVHSPAKLQSPRLYSSNRDSNEHVNTRKAYHEPTGPKNHTIIYTQTTSQRNITPPKKQHGGGNLCEFKIQSVRSLATPERRPIPKSTTQYLHYPFPSSYQYVPAVPPPGASTTNRQYFTLNETNTLIPITQQHYGTSYPIRDMRTFRHDHHQPEGNSYKIKSSALKNHEPYIIHHPTHVHRAYHTELPSHYPVYTHHPRYIKPSGSDIAVNPARNMVSPPRKGRFIKANDITNRPPNPNFVETVRPRNSKVDNIVEAPTQRVVEGYSAVRVVTEPMHVLPKHKWSTPVSCNI